MLPVLNSCSSDASARTSPGRLVVRSLESGANTTQRQTSRGTASADTQHSSREAASERKLTSATFLLKYDCNLKCSFCLNAWRGKSRANDELTFAQQKETLRKMKDAGIKHVTFTGGEPALHSQLADLILFAYDLGMTTILQTNGTLLSDEFLKQVKPVIGGIQISLHGLKEEQKRISGFDCFEKISVTMDKVRAHNIPLFTNLVANKKNVHVLKDYVSFLNFKQVAIASFTRLYPAGNALANWRELVLSADEYASFCKTLEELQKSSKTKLYLAGPNDTDFLLTNNISLNNATCGAGRTEIAINPNGDILACPSWNEPAGNVLMTNFKTAWDAGFLAELGKSHDGTQGCMLARKRGARELEQPLKTAQPLHQQKRDNGNLDYRAFNASV